MNTMLHLLPVIAFFIILLSSNPGAGKECKASPFGAGAGAAPTGDRRQRHSTPPHKARSCSWVNSKTKPRKGAEEEACGSDWVRGGGL